MTGASHHREDNIRLAIGAVILAVFALSLGDALIKKFSATFVLWQVFVLRSVISVPFLIAIIRLKREPVPLMPVHLGWTTLRSFMLAGQWIAYYMALPHVELSVAASGFYTLPLFITLFAAMFAGETVGRFGWIAVCLGFLGVLLVLKPQAGDFNAYALLPLVAAVLYAGAMVLTRTKCKGEQPLILSLGLNVAMLVTGLAAMTVIGVWQPAAETVSTYTYLLGEWSIMDGMAWTMMGTLALAIIVGSVGAAIAYQSGPSSVVAPYDFFYVGFATLWGLVFFAEIPDAVTASGMALIVAAGILSLKR